MPFNSPSEVFPAFSETSPTKRVGAPAISTTRPNGSRAIQDGRGGLCCECSASDLLLDSISLCLPHHLFLLLGIGLHIPIRTHRQSAIYADHCRKTCHRPSRNDSGPNTKHVAYRPKIPYAGRRRRRRWIVVLRTSNIDTTTWRQALYDYYLKCAYGNDIITQVERSLRFTGRGRVWPSHGQCVLRSAYLCVAEVWWW